MLVDLPRSLFTILGRKCYVRAAWHETGFEVDTEGPNRTTGAPEQPTLEVVSHISC